MIYLKYSLRPFGLNTQNPVGGYTLDYAHEPPNDDQEEAIFTALDPDQYISHGFVFHKHLPCFLEIRNQSVRDFQTEDRAIVGMARIGYLHHDKVKGPIREYVEATCNLETYRRASNLHDATLGHRAVFSEGESVLCREMIMKLYEKYKKLYNSSMQDMIDSVNKTIKEGEGLK